MKKFKPGLLLKVVIAIITGILLGLIAPAWLSRLSLTISTLFGNFLGFVIPLIILGLVAPGIADIGKGAGKLLVITVALAYGSSVFSGYFTYGACSLTYPLLLEGSSGFGQQSEAASLAPYFDINMPPVMGVMSALILAFIIGVTVNGVKGDILKNGMDEFREIVVKVITSAIVPLLPVYIACIFLNIASSGQVAGIISVFILIVIIIFVLHVILLLLYYFIAAWVAGGNPFKYLRTMLPAYMTALGTQSSAATIPVTLEQTIQNGVDEDVAGFTVPLCATIHLAGSMMKITGCALAIMYVSGMHITFAMMSEFIFMLAITMVAAPGVPGGAIIAATGVLTSILGFDKDMNGLMIALYIAMDSFGTACNVAGDGAIAIIVNKINKKYRAKALPN